MAPSSAQSSPEVDRKAELERIRRQIEGLEERLADVSARHGDHRQQLDRLRIEIELQQERVAEAREERRLAEERLTELASSIEILKARLEVSRRQLQRGLAALYRVGRGGVWRWLVAGSEGSRSLAGQRTLRYLSLREAERVQAYDRDRTRLSREREEWHDHSLRSRELLRSETTRLGRLHRLRRREARVVADLRREEERLAARAAALIERQTKLTDLFAFLSSETAEADGGRPIQRFKGVLDWPLAGRVVERFGPRLDPLYQTRVPHNGITLQAAQASDVHAIFPGRVVFAAPFEGFGVMVVLLHADRVFTLYSGLAAASVEKDALISAGQVLGRAAERMYFEVRVEQNPEDPLDWLR